MRVDEAAAGPDAFLAPESDVMEVVRKATKAIYDHTARYAPCGDGVVALDQLHVDGFDAEQVWQQIEMQNRSVVRRVRRLHKRFKDAHELVDGPIAQILGLKDKSAAKAKGKGKGKRRMAAKKVQMTQPKEGKNPSPREGLEEEEEEDPDVMHRSEDSEDESDMGGSSESEGQEADEKEGPKLAPTEDEFFRLDDMEKFVQDAEEAAYDDDRPDMLSEGDDGSESDGYSDEVDKMLEGKGGEFDTDDEDEDEEDAELREALDSVSKRMKNNTGAGSRKQRASSGDSIAPYMANDFFLPNTKPARAKSNTGGTRESPAENQAKKVRFEFDQDEEQVSDEMPESDDVENTYADGSHKSTHEIRMERMAEKIKKLEEANMAEKGWEYTGEVQASQRPVNSALEVDLEFDHARPPPPAVTEEVTQTIEDIIKQRIVEGRFDDVVRVAVSDDSNKEKKKHKELGESEKSSKGLGELYEEDYMKEKHNLPLNEKEEALRVEARTLFNRLSQKLDALSHFHFAPKPAVEELAVKDIPALAVEEVGPSATSLAAAKAPQEVYRSATGGAPKAEEEYTREERKARRARKKRKQKSVRAEREEKKRLRTQAVLAAGGGAAGQAMVSAGIVPAKSAAAGSGTGVPMLRKAKMSSAPGVTKSGDVFKLLQEQQDLASGGQKTVKTRRQETTEDPDRLRGSALLL